MLVPSFFDVFLELSLDERFAPYMTNVNDFIPLYHFDEDPLAAVSENIKAANLKLEHISLKSISFEFKSEQVLKGKFC